MRPALLPALAALALLAVAGGALALLSPACADRDRAKAPSGAPRVPDEPDAALLWVRASAGDEVELRRRLGAWPLKDAAFAAAQASQVVVTWRLRHALGDGDLAEAMRCFDYLRETFGGGLSPEGRALDAVIVAGAIFDEALGRAREHVEGLRPDVPRAHAALEVARTLDARHLRGNGEAAARRAACERWVRIERGSDLGSLLDIDLAGGARVLVFADDFALGESVFLTVLSRWQRQGGADLPVEVVGLLTGQVRMGIRRLPAESTQAERASIAARAREAGLALAPAVLDGIEATRLGRVGLGPQQSAIVVVDAGGRIVGRLSGTNVDPRGLDVVVERMVSR